MRLRISLFLLSLGLALIARPENALSQRDIERGVQSHAASDIAKIARDLSDKASDARNVAINNRSSSSVDLYVALHAFAGGTQAYREMAADGRDEATLRSVAAWLIARGEEVDSVLNRADTRYVHNDWQLVQEQLRRLSDRFNLKYRSRAAFTSNAPRGLPATDGYFKWRGRVDGSDHILLQGSRVSIRHLDARPIRDASFDLPDPLPRQRLTLQLTKLRGRGTVEIIRQPDRSNNFTATVFIEDPLEGDDYYEFELRW